MEIDMDLLFDFSLNLPRIVVSSNLVIIDNVKSIMSFSSTGMVADTGTRFTAVSGEDITIRNLKDDRVVLIGKINSVEFFPNKKGD
ncbi:MAG: YabP/YqfC family sporulation protein [Clostridia bacterium]|nr:YabP/YqfC family sporulation protein [Clostridia bacterium]